MDVPVRSGDVLAQPTRARVFELLADLRRPATTDELAERLGMHPNGVRLHLERLLGAGLVAKTRERIARGRPRDVWTISADAEPGGDPPTGYADLARWLVRSLAVSGAPIGNVEEAGCRIGADIAADVDGVDGSEQRVFDTLAAMGFQPEREPAGGEQLTYELRNCPYRDAVRENQPVVCALHRGITRGLLGAVSPESELAGFEPKDPDLAGCLIRVRGPITKPER